MIRAGWDGEGEDRAGMVIGGGWGCDIFFVFLGGSSAEVWGGRRRRWRRWRRRGYVMWVRHGGEGGEGKGVEWSG